MAGPKFLAIVIRYTRVVGSLTIPAAHPALLSAYACNGELYIPISRRTPPAECHPVACESEYQACNPT